MENLGANYRPAPPLIMCGADALVFTFILTHRTPHETMHEKDIRELPLNLLCGTSFLGVPSAFDC